MVQSATIEEGLSKQQQQPVSFPVTVVFDGLDMAGLLYICERKACVTLC